MIQNHSHGCLIDFPDLLSYKNPKSHTERKANEVNVKAKDVEKGRPIVLTLLKEHASKSGPGLK